MADQEFERSIGLPSMGSGLCSFLQGWADEHFGEVVR